MSLAAAHICPDPLPVGRWFNENRSDATPDAKPFERWFKEHQPEVVIGKGSFALPQLRRIRVEGMGRSIVKRQELMPKD